MSLTEWELTDWHSLSLTQWLTHTHWHWHSQSQWLSLSHTTTYCMSLFSLMIVFSLSSSWSHLASHPKEAQLQQTTWSGFEQHVVLGEEEEEEEEEEGEPNKDCFQSRLCGPLFDVWDKSLCCWTCVIFCLTCILTKSLCCWTCHFLFVFIWCLIFDQVLLLWDLCHFSVFILTLIFDFFFFDFDCFGEALFNFSLRFWQKTVKKSHRFVCRGKKSSPTMTLLLL